MSERDKRSIETVQTAASSVVLSRCASELALRLNAHEYLMHGHTTDRRQRLVVSRTHHTHVTSAWHHVHSSLRRTERSRRTTWSKCVSALRSTQGSRGHAMRARERALLRDHPGELRPAVRRAPAQDAAASAAWHAGRPFERPLQTGSEGNFWVNFLFQGETAYDACPFLDENPKKRFRAFPKRIAQMAAAAKVALMEAQSGEERKWGAGTGGDHSPDTLPHRTHLTVPSWTLCAHAMTRLSVMLRLRP